MSLWELFVIALGLSMDAFAVSIGKGLCVREIRPKHTAIVGLYFGGFQAGMPLIGYFLGARFESRITGYDHWIAFALLALIGGRMVIASRRDDGAVNASFDVKSMLPLAVATSIDALAVGVTFAFLNVEIVPAVSLIGVVTFIVSGVGLKIGNVFGVKYKSGAELFGGVVLILMGIKILLDHMGIIAW